MKQCRSCLAAAFLVLTAATTWVAAEAVAEDAVGDILARWEGGELSRERFVAAYDSGGEAIADGGARLQAALCHAVFREIYGRRAASLRLDEDPDTLHFMADWRDGNLASAYLERRLAELPGEIPDDQVKRYYEENLSDFEVPVHVDLGVVFVRCGEESAAREAGRARMAALRERAVAAGAPGMEALQDLVAEERERSGPANGFFAGVPLPRLPAPVAEAVQATPVGSYSGVVETPIGLFWLWLGGRSEPTVASLDDARPRILSALRSEREQELKLQELQRWRERLGEQAAGLGDTAVLAAAARASGLHMTPEILDHEQKVLDEQLALRALERDQGITLSDEEIARQLAANPGREKRLRRFWLDVVVAEPQLEPYATHLTAQQIAERLDAAADPAAVARALGDELPGVAVHRLGPLPLSDLRMVDPGVAKAAAELEPGGWQGPINLDDPFTVTVIVGEPKDLPELGKGLAFVVLERSELPPPAELRERFLEQYRRQLLREPDACRAAFAERWGLELFPEAGAEGPSSAP